MLPIILISSSKEKIQQWIAEYIQTHSFSPYLIFTVEPVKTELSIDQIRELKKELILTPASKRLVILHSFDTASTEAQNALLKTLEEKNESNQFILSAINHEYVLPTIKSRSRTVSLDSLESHVNAIRPTSLDIFKRVEVDVSYTFLSDGSMNPINRDDALLLFDEAILYLKDKIIDDSKGVVSIKKALQLKSLLQSNNLNPQLAIDSFFIFYRKSLSK